MIYDVIVIGAGPAGLTAAIYAVRRNLKTAVIEKGLVGGRMLLANEIGNYPGFEGISGKELASRMETQAKKLGVEFFNDEVVGLKLDGDEKRIKTQSMELLSKAVIIATGGRHRELGVKGEKEFLGKGVSYCATCDAPFFKNKNVAVIGGGNSAVGDAIYLLDIAKKVYLIHRKEMLRAEEARQKTFLEKGGELIPGSVVEEISGDPFVRSIVVNDVKANKKREIDVEGVFISIGTVPDSDFVREHGVEVEESGEIKVNDNQETNILGVYAAGDVTKGIRQIATAVGEGCVAGLKAYDYIKKPYWSR